jgi:hypothetical protein
MMDARLSTAQVRFRIDVNFGDPLTPAPMPVILPSLRPTLPDIRVLGYPKVFSLRRSPLLSTSERRTPGSGTMSMSIRLRASVNSAINRSVRPC